ncbi:DUF6148 family protein [Desulfosarcina sp. OttesenSCG-928-A07]|nr:DUF6148 family protein [Desulfosarcina sp. OttesenSCG-928-G17]MDL2329076.1 DUF6148 family protein [Desulfosarcina sp. OttesenSCG-928-A07]
MSATFHTSIWTRDELLSLRSLWKAAYKAAATGKSYTIEGRSLTRQNLNEIRAQLSYIQDELDALSGRGGPHIVVARPRR